MSGIAPRWEIAVEGEDISRNISGDVMSVSFEDHATDADMVSLQLANPGNRWSDAALFDPANLLELSLGYGASLVKVFKGPIVRPELSFPEDGVPGLTLRAYDLSHRFRKLNFREAFEVADDAGNQRADISLAVKPHYAAQLGDVYDGAQAVSVDLSGNNWIDLKGVRLPNSGSPIAKVEVATAGGLLPPYGQAYGTTRLRFAFYPETAPSGFETVRFGPQTVAVETENFIPLKYIPLTLWCQRDIRNREEVSLRAVCVHQSAVRIP